MNASERAKARAVKDNAHARHVLATYGITGEEYWELYRLQGGKCAVCAWATGKTKRLAVDHDHSCLEGHPKDRGCLKCVRGLCCGPCNRLLGRMRDDPAAFVRAAEYLLEPPFQSLRLQAS